ncbi:ATP synthase-coupling factor 6 mitochondrial [Dissostichus eleginoides]|uniref:ATP synthase peripheral stalk subunit F6, mitochondrial n=1 Tax=Dissostichus eleginoides TaxID=100907 RepID=A0AAD9B8E5_DISEL|nr:ATP synthase-coupling factor 6 mitochondrial [Dissostichus eleginoides]
MRSAAQTRRLSDVLESHTTSHNPPLSTTFGYTTQSVKSKMALHRLFQLSSVLRSSVSLTLRRNIGLSAVVFNRAKDLDPIQKLFLDKIRSYKTKSRASGGVVDGDASYDKNVSDEIFKLQRLYGGGDLDKFPELKFTDPTHDDAAK